MRAGYRTRRSGRGPRRSVFDGRAIEQFDNVENFLAGAIHRSAGTKLQNASGIRCHDGLRAGLLRVAHLFLQQGHRRVRFRHIVDTRRAATVIRERHLDQFYARNGANESARRFADFLPMQQDGRNPA